MASLLSKLLVESGLASPEQVEAAEAHGKATGQTLGEALEDLGVLGGDEIARFLSTRYQLSSIDFDDFEPDPAMLTIVPAETVRRLRLVPLARAGTTVTVATDEPWKTPGFEDVRFITGYTVEPVVVAPGAMTRAIERFYGTPRSPRAGGAERAGPSRAEGEDPELLTREDLAALEGFELVDESLLEAAVVGESPPGGEPRTGDPEEIDLRDPVSLGATPAARLAILILVEALKRRASHVLVEPLRRELRVRLRVDGALQPLETWPPKLHGPLAERIKSMAGLNLLEKQQIQAGWLGLRLRAEGRGEDLRFRVSTLPTAWGETLVLRRLDPWNPLIGWTTLGFDPPSLERFRRAIDRPSGLVLITGPSGSGRTWTLASAAAFLNGPGVHVVDASPAHEIRLPGVDQVVVPRDRLGDTVGFLLTQNPDVLLWDGVPDEAWPGLVDAAGPRGRVVLATLDEPDTMAAVRAFVSCGVPAPALARALRAVVAQRLVRRLCVECREDTTSRVLPETYRALRRTFLGVGFPPDQWGAFPIFAPASCPACRHTGYVGRVGLFEVMPVSESLRELVRSAAAEHEIRTKALDEGMITLRRAGLEKIRQGVTTIDEVVRHTDH